MNAIRKNSFVTNNQPVKPNYSWQKEIPVGTEFIVSKRAKDGTLYLHATNPELSVSYNTLLHESQVTKITKNYPMPKVGDLFYSSWGYEQTNIDFYQVTNTTSKCIELTPIHSETKRDNYLSGYKRPIRNSFFGSPKLHKVNFNSNGQPSVKLTSYSYAWPANENKDYFFSEYH